MKQKISFILRIVISLSLIGLLLWFMRDNLGQIFQMLKSVKKGAFFLCTALFLLAVSILAIRFRKLLLSQNLKLNLAEAASLTYVGLFFNNFLPTAIGGDMVKGYYTSKKTSKGVESFTAVFVDRAVGMFSFIALATLALFFVGRSFLSTPLVILVAILFLAGILTFIILMAWKEPPHILNVFTPLLKRLKLDEKMKKLYVAVNNYRNQWRVLWEVFWLSIAAQVIAVTAIYVLGKGLNAAIPLKLIWLAYPLICVMSMAPSINGLGVREGGFVLFFAPVIGKETAFALGILWLAQNMIASLIGGVVYLVGFHNGIKAVPVTD